MAAYQLGEGGSRRVPILTPLVQAYHTAAAAAAAAAAVVSVLCCSPAGTWLCVEHAWQQPHIAAAAATMAAMQRHNGGSSAALCVEPQYRNTLVG
jgi:hypothetical protein